MDILNEIARVAGWAVFMVILGCIALVIITGIQNLIDEIKWCILGRSLPARLQKYQLQVNIKPWSDGLFSVMLTNEKDVLFVSHHCKWEKIDKVIAGLMSSYLEELSKNEH